MINSNADTTRPPFQAFKVLYFGFIALPLIAGLDKFFHILVNWNLYLSPMISNMIPAATFMKIVGVVTAFNASRMQKTFHRIKILFLG